MIKAILHIATLLVFFFINNLCSGQISVQKISHHQVYNDVFIIEGKDTVNLTKFDSWQEIADIALSTDSHYCFVRHKPNIKNTSYRLALYDTKTKRLIKEIIPGYGGRFEWNTNHQIIHSWGCGTNCANLRVYDLHLKEIFFTLSAGGFMFSPEKNFIVQLSMSGDKIWVFDLKSLEKSSHPLTFYTIIDFDYDWQDFQFISEYELAFVNQISKNINLKTVKWLETDPKKTGNIKK